MEDLNPNGVSTVFRAFASLGCLPG